MSDEFAQVQIISNSVAEQNDWQSHRARLLAADPEWEARHTALEDAQRKAQAAEHARYEARERLEADRQARVAALMYAAQTTQHGLAGDVLETARVYLAFLNGEELAPKPQ